MDGLRWARGCGTGIGLSGHKNEFAPVVAINNFLEDRAAAGDSQWHRFGAHQSEKSTYQDVHNRTPEEVAAALGNCTATIPRDLLKQDKGKNIMFEHLGPRQQPPDTFISTNSLTYSAPYLEKRQLQKELWCGAKAIDLKVTHKQAPAGHLTADKSASWVAHATPERCSKYASSSRTAQMHTALLSDPRKRDLKAAAANTTSPDSGCQQPTVGRKVTGEMCGWLERKEKFINMLEARKPIDYTVTLTCKHAYTGNTEELADEEETGCLAQGADTPAATQQPVQHSTAI